MKTFKSNPHFTIGTTKIPTWTTPIVLVLFVSFLVPNTSFLGHLCGLSFGYGCEQGHSTLRGKLTICRGPRIPQISCTSREGPSVDRREVESAGKIATLRLSRSENIWQIWSVTNCCCCRERRCAWLCWRLAKIGTMRGDHMRCVKIHGPLYKE